MRAATVLLITGAFACCSGCGGEDREPDPGAGRSAADVYQQVEESDRQQTVAEEPATTRDDALRRDRAAARRRLGSRSDFKVPRSVLAGKSDDDVWYIAIERIFLELETPYESDARFARLTAGQRALYVLYWADAEILNGGFSQFYFNSTGYFAPDLPDAAKRVGAQDHRDVAATANALLAGSGTPVPRARAARERLLDRVPEEALSRLDERWFSLDERSVLATRAAAYVRGHLSEFVAP